MISVRFDEIPPLALVSGMAILDTTAIVREDLGTSANGVVSLITLSLCGLGRGFSRGTVGDIGAPPVLVNAAFLRNSSANLAAAVGCP